MTQEIKDWIKAAAIRAAKTAAQTAVSMIGVGTAIQDVDWALVASTAALAAALSVLTSIAGIPEVASGQRLTDIILGR